MPSGKQKYRCKMCMKVLRDNNYTKNKEKILAKHQQYRSENPEKYLDSRKKSYAKNKKKWQEAKKETKWWRTEDKTIKSIRQKRFKHNAVKELKDVYVKQMLCRDLSVSAKDIPQPLVELKKSTMALKREIRKRKVNQNEN